MPSPSISKTDPAKGQAINAHIQRTTALYQASQEAQQQQAQQAQRQLQNWVSEEDKAFDTQFASKHSAEEMRAISQSAVELAAEPGIDKQQLQELWNTQPIMRSRGFQTMMAMAAQYKMAQKGVAEKVSKPVPPVQRPGVAGAHRSDDGVEQATAAWNKSQTLQSAAALITARRAARR